VEQDCTILYYLFIITLQLNFNSSVDLFRQYKVEFTEIVRLKNMTKAIEAITELSKMFADICQVTWFAHNRTRERGAPCIYLSRYTSAQN
jgi:hypothetical protein